MQSAHQMPLEEFCLGCEDRSTTQPPRVDLSGRSIQTTASIEPAPLTSFRSQGERYSSYRFAISTFSWTIANCGLLD